MKKKNFLNANITPGEQEENVFGSVIVSESSLDNNFESSLYVIAAKIKEPGKSSVTIVKNLSLIGLHSDLSDKELISTFNDVQIQFIGNVKRKIDMLEIINSRGNPNEVKISG